MLALVLAYAGGHLLWYWTTPLGRTAVLDERENLALAQAIANGTLAPEPFYRAMGYPLLLAGLAATGLLPAGAPFAATALGLLLHLLNTALAMRLARGWFGSPAAGWLAGALVGLNPVFIHYATQVLDSTFAGTLLLAGLLALPTDPDRRAGPGRAAWLSAAWAAAALVRPQLLLVWLAWPLIWWVATAQPFRLSGKWLGAGLAAGGALWLAQGAWCAHVSGEFRLLPWQGPFNLWAANHPGATGRYFVQSRNLDGLLAPGHHENPARLEAELLWREATGATGPVRPDVLNAYWSARLRADLAADPGGALTLFARKLVWLFSDAEGYNNKTFSFHRTRSPWLRFNPLGWAVIAVLGAAGLLVLQQRRTPAGRALPWLLAALAAGIVLSYVSARFRLPLALVLAVCAGGAANLPAAWRAATPRRRLGLAGLPAALGLVALANLAGADDQRTYVQDHLLIAAAAERTGDDLAAWQEADAALRLQPGRAEAGRLALAAGFNLILAGHPAAPDAAAWTAVARTVFAASADPVLHPQANLFALALWRSGDPAGITLWRRVAGTGDPEARAALRLAGEAAGPEPAGKADGNGVFSRLEHTTDPELLAARDRLFRRP